MTKMKKGLNIILVLVALAVLLCSLTVYDVDDNEITLTPGQWGIYDVILEAWGEGASHAGVQVESFHDTYTVRSLVGEGMIVDERTICKFALPSGYTITIDGFSVTVCSGSTSGFYEDSCFVEMFYDLDAEVDGTRYSLSTYSHFDRNSGEDIKTFELTAE